MQNTQYFRFKWEACGLDSTSFECAEYDLIIFHKDGAFQKSIDLKSGTFKSFKGDVGRGIDGSIEDKLIKNATFEEVCIKEGLNPEMDCFLGGHIARNSPEAVIILAAGVPQTVKVPCHGGSTVVDFCYDPEQD